MDLSYSDAKKIIDCENGILLDVREECEYITGHATGALLFPVDSIDETHAKELLPSKEQPILVYCRTGNRAQMAKERLHRLGYLHVYNLRGLSSWPYGIDYGTD